MDTPEARKARCLEILAKTTAQVENGEVTELLVMGICSDSTETELSVTTQAMMKFGNIQRVCERQLIRTTDDMLKQMFGDDV